ncbi:hypothetical protein MUK42_26157 [Musa troglodytarum]|uniref:Uncharacterized protein n=1 Tax=Musa troglodytarum TaxID=320322 RepID=A0A9E7FLJ3_9LILI|nr:hypothetical protein MUK42_26157 [Musa troglodytarum]
MERPRTWIAAPHPHHTNPTQPPPNPPHPSPPPPALSCGAWSAVVSIRNNWAAAGPAASSPAKLGPPLRYIAFSASLPPLVIQWMPWETGEDSGGGSFPRPTASTVPGGGPIPPPLPRSRSISASVGGFSPTSPQASFHRRLLTLTGDTVAQLRDRFVVHACRPSDSDDKVSSRH